MPGGVSGVDLARSVSINRPDTAILLTTGYAGDHMDGAPADLPWLVLRKPFQVDQLAEIAAALLDGQDAPKRTRKTAVSTRKRRPRASRAKTESFWRDNEALNQALRA